MDYHAFLGVSRSTSWLELEPGDEAYWCLFSSYEAEAGDVLVLYYTRLGIAQIWRIVAPRAAEPEWRCSERGMVTVPTELLLSLEEPITAREMKADPVLQDAGFVNRNFQATAFRIRADQWHAMIQLMCEENPELADDLDTLR
jgi:predicted RNA-binding protein with PUA-like domain